MDSISKGNYQKHAGQALQTLLLPVFSIHTLKMTIHTQKQQFIVLLSLFHCRTVNLR